MQSCRWRDPRRFVESCFQSTPRCLQEQFFQLWQRDPQSVISFVVLSVLQTTPTCLSSIIVSALDSMPASSKCVTDMYFISQAVYNVGFNAFISGQLDMAALRVAITMTFERQEVRQVDKKQQF